MDNFFRIMCCMNCDGSGRAECAWSDLSYRCSVCDGTGGVEVAVEPIDMADLEAMEG